MAGRMVSGKAQINSSRSGVLILVDEDVAIEAARCLRQGGHKVLLVPEMLGVRTDDVDTPRLLHLR
jgi:hypothetical protein